MELRQDSFYLCIYIQEISRNKTSINLEAFKINVVLFLASIFGVCFCQTIYEPVDVQELGFLQESRLYALVSRIDNCEIQRNYEKGFLSEKFTTTENILKSGLEMITRLDFIIDFRKIKNVFRFLLYSKQL